MKAWQLAAKHGHKIGCGDNSCMFGSPNGMGTNGGCQCHDGDCTDLRKLIRVLAAVLAATAKEAS